MRIARLLAFLNLASWSEHALTTANSVAAVIGITAAAVVLLAIGFIYFTGHELNTRIRTKADAIEPGPPVLFGQAERRNGQEAVSPTPPSTPLPFVDAGRISELQKELASARKAEENKASRLDQLDSELAKARKAGELTEARVAQLQNELATSHQSEEGKAARLGELERQLTETRRAEKERAERVVLLEKNLAVARQSAEEASAQTKEIAFKQGPRRISLEQRKGFLDATKGLAKGKVIVSAFFDNRETHDFGAEVLGLLKEAGFEVVERAPVNFFTTSRPSSGIRIGCQDMGNPPLHFLTVRKALAAVGLEAPDTTVVNADEPEVVEIQITPRQ